MFRAIAILASIVGASAFAPAGRMAVRSSLKMGYETEVRYIHFTCLYTLKKEIPNGLNTSNTTHIIPIFTCIISLDVIICKQLVWPTTNIRQTPFFSVA